MTNSMGAINTNNQYHGLLSWFKDWKLPQLKLWIAVTTRLFRVMGSICVETLVSWKSRSVGASSTMLFFKWHWTSTMKYHIHKHATLSGDVNVHSLKSWRACNKEQTDIWSWQQSNNTQRGMVGLHCIKAGLIGNIEENIDKEELQTRGAVLKTETAPSDASS